MKMTIITDSNGKLVGAVQGHTLTSKHGNLEARVSFASGNKMHKVDVEDDMDKIVDPVLFQNRLLKHLPKT